MARQSEFDLFTSSGEFIKEVKIPLKVPSKEMVDQYVKRTGKSTRQCYFWAFRDLNQKELQLAADLASKSNANELS